MFKKKSNNAIPIILSLLLLFMNIFISSPESAIFSILYSLFNLAILTFAIFLFYVQVKESGEK